MLEENRNKKRTKDERKTKPKRNNQFKSRWKPKDFDVREIITELREKENYLSESLKREMIIII